LRARHFVFGLRTATIASDLALNDNEKRGGWRDAKARKVKHTARIEKRGGGFGGIVLSKNFYATR
jgi:hypothetical protein